MNKVKRYFLLFILSGLVASEMSTQDLYQEIKQKMKSDLKDILGDSELYVGECFFMREDPYSVEEYKKAHTYSKDRILARSLCIKANNKFSLHYSLSDGEPSLRSIWVKDDLRGKGIGGKLVDATIYFARKMGAHSITVVNKGDIKGGNSKKNKKFWNAHGFKAPNARQPLILVKELS